MDGFLLKCAEELNLSLPDFGFPDKLIDFTSITKSVTSKNDKAFKKLFKAMEKASEMLVLKKWLEYLKKNQYGSKEEDLKRIVYSVH